MGADATAGNRLRPRRDAFTWERGEIKSIRNLRHARTRFGYPRIHIGPVRRRDVDGRNKRGHDVMRWREGAYELR